MTPSDYKQITAKVETASRNVRHELCSIKKEKLQLSARIKIERAIAKLEIIEIFMDINFQ